MAFHRRKRGIDSGADRLAQAAGVERSIQALLVATASLLKGRIVGLSAGAVLMGIPEFTVRGASQCADIPLAFFILATIALMALSQRGTRETRVLIVISGTAAALAAWTKNEGLPFFLVALVACYGLGVSTRSRAQALREVGMFLAGASPILAVLVLFKTSFAPANSYASAMSLDYILSCLVDPSRYAVITRALWNQLAHLDLLPCALACLLPICLGTTRRPELRTAGVAALSIVSLMAGAYFLVYVITPAWFDLAWTVRVSCTRLQLHLWPALLFGIALMVPRPR